MKTFTKYLTLILLFVSSLIYSQGAEIGRVKGLMSQYSTNPPTLIIFENTFGYDIETAYIDKGVYTLRFKGTALWTGLVYIQMPRVISAPDGSRWNYVFDYSIGGDDDLSLIYFISKRYDYGTVANKIYDNSLYNGIPFEIIIYDFIQ